MELGELLPRMVSMKASAAWSGRATAFSNARVLVLVLLLCVQTASFGNPRDSRAQTGTPRRTQAGPCGSSRSGRWVVSPEHVGPIPIPGLTMERLRQLCPEATDFVGDLSNSGLASVVVPAFAGQVLFYPQVGSPELGAIARGPVSFVLVKTPSVRTASGLGVGSTLAEVRARYGSVLIVFAESIGARAMPRYAQGRPPRGIAFVLADFDAVTRAGGGWEGDTLRHSRRVPSSVRVEAVEVWQPRLAPPEE